MAPRPPCRCVTIRPAGPPMLRARLAADHAQAVGVLQRCAVPTSSGLLGCWRCRRAGRATQACSPRRRAAASLLKITPRAGLAALGRKIPPGGCLPSHRHVPICQLNARVRAKPVRLKVGSGRVLACASGS